MKTSRLVHRRPGQVLHVRGEGNPFTWIEDISWWWIMSQQSSEFSWLAISMISVLLPNISAAVTLTFTFYKSCRRQNELCHGKMCLKIFVVAPPFGMTLTTGYNMRIIWVQFYGWRHAQRRIDGVPPANPATNPCLGMTTKKILTLWVLCLCAYSQNHSKSWPCTVCLQAPMGQAFFIFFLGGGRVTDQVYVCKIAQK